MDNRLLDFMTALERTTNLATAWSETVAALVALGADDIIYGTAQTLTEINFRTTVPDWWMGHYQDNGYGLHDIQARHAVTKIAPATLDITAVPARSDLTDQEKKVSMEFSETGVRQAVTIPLRLPFAPGSVGGFSILSKSHRPDFEKWLNENGAAVHLTAVLAHTTIQHLSLEERRAEISLTDREKECLLWIAKGLRTGRIAERLGLADVTVSLHLSNARKKLGAATREQAVAQAIMLQLITP